MSEQKPKPIRNWRSFAKEYVIVVLGVATALAAQQAAEWWNNRSRAAEARAGIREEIARNLGRIDVRQRIEGCIARRLDDVDGLIAASAAGRLPQDVLWIGAPTTLDLFDSTYKAAMQSGAVSLFGYQEQRAYTNLYVAFEKYTQAGVEEQHSWDDLRTLEKQPAPSPTLDWQLRSALQQARLARTTIASMRYWTTQDSAAIGIAP